MIGRRAFLLATFATTASFGAGPVRAATCEDRLKSVIAEHLDVSAARIVPSATFVDLGADSLDIVELTMAVEEEFNIKIPEKKSEALCTVGDVLQHVNRTVKPACR